MTSDDDNLNLFLTQTLKVEKCKVFSVPNK